MSLLQPDEYIYQEGERPTELYRIRTGIVALESVNVRGERCIFHLVGRGTLLGHETLMQQPRTFDARACTEVIMETMRLPAYPDPTLSDSLLRRAHAAVASLLQEATRFKVELHRAQAYEKVLLLLEQIRKLQPEKADACWLPTRSEMADILDINHATASRVVARLFREGVLQRSASKESAQIDWDHIRRLRSA
jgi:CRP-like cAMP-binding protein